MDAMWVFFAGLTLVISSESQCSEPAIVSSPSNADICQVASQGSLSYTCSDMNAVIWTSSVLTNALTVIAGISSNIPPLSIAGITLVENHNTIGSCISSTLTFIPTSTSLVVLDGVMLICGAPGISTDTIVIFAPAIHNPSPPALKNISSFCEHNGGQVALQWTAPNKTGGQGVEIKRYLLNVTGQPEYNCPTDQCNVTTTNTTITGLQCNTSYTISVKAVNCYKKGNSSKFVVITVPLLAENHSINITSTEYRSLTNLITTAKTTILNNITSTTFKISITTNSGFATMTDSYTIATSVDIATTLIPSNMESINLAVIAGSITGAFIIAVGILCFAVCFSCMALLKHKKGALSSSKTMNKNRMEIKCNEAYGQVSSFLHNSSTPVLPVLSTSQILSMQDNQCYGQSQIQVSESDEINLRENVCYSQAKDSVFVQENVSYSEAKTAPIYESLLY